MIHYRDRAFCVQECGNAVCYRNYTETEREKNTQGPDLPVAFADFKTDDCGYLPPNENCWRCGDGEPDSWESACIDDMCHGGEVPCMHGDWARLPCSACGK